MGSDNGVLAEQLLRERDRAEELNNRLNKAAKEVSEAGQRESELRTGLGAKEKELALLRHQLKEVQRKSEQDAEVKVQAKVILNQLYQFHVILTQAKRKAESERSEMRKRLEDETNKRTREQNNSHHVAEKIAALEGEKRELADKLKKESENLEKLKKANTEMSVARGAAEASMGDLNDKVKN